MSTPLGVKTLSKHALSERADALPFSKPELAATAHARVATVPESDAIVIHKSTIETVIEFLADLARPVAKFIGEVAGNGWIGFAIIFFIFFSVFLLKSSVLSRNHAGYSNGLSYIGSRGLMVVILCAVFMAFDYVLTPFLALAVRGLWGSVTSSDVALGSMVGMWMDGSDWRGDIARFWNADRLLLPIGPRSLFLVGVAFATMQIVGQALHNGRE